MALRAEHCWKEKTADGLRREIRASRFGGEWKLQSKLSGEERWTYHSPPATADLQALLELVKRKYQRRRASHDDVMSIERLLKQK